MVSLNVTIKPSLKSPQKMLIEINAAQFERLAATLGFFSREFLKSVDRAERDFQKGRVKKLRSLKDLRG